MDQDVAGMHQRNDKGTPSPQQTSVSLDALPYVDDMPEEYEHYALALIEEEMTKSQSEPFMSLAGVTRMKRLPPVSFRSSELMQHQYNQCPEPDKHVQTPSIFSELPHIGETDLDKWGNRVSRARVEYELERMRSLILNTQKDEQSTLWKDWNTVRQLVLERWLQTQQMEQLEVEEINHGRRSEQLRHKEHLQVANAKYHELVHKVHRLRQVTAEMESYLEMKKPS